jgi:hypothetical protein
MNVKELDSLRRTAFQVVMRQLLEHFPSALSDISPKLFDMRENSTKAKFEGRLRDIYAASKFFDTPEGHDVKFLKYMDTLFVSILESTAPHHLLLAAVFDALSKMSKTHRNRLRIENIYRVHLNRYLKQFQVLPESMKPTFSHMLSLFYRLISKWNTLPSDSLCFLSELSNEAVHRLGPFAVRRREFLNSLAGVDDVECDTDIDTRKEIAKNAHMEPYDAKDFSCYTVKPFLYSSRARKNY